MESVRLAGGKAGWRRARPLLAATAVAGVLAVAISILPLQARLGTALGNGLQLAAAATAAWACLAEGRRKVGHARTGWLLLGAGAGAWTMGQVIWTWHEVVRGVEVPLPGLNDVCYLALFPLALAGLLYLSPLADRHGLVRLALVLDGVLSALGIFVLLWPLVLDPAFNRIDDPAAAYVTIAYPLGDLLLLGLAGGILLRSWANVRSGLGLAYAAFTFLLVADLNWTTGIFADSYATGQVADAGWIVGFLLLAAAARAPAPLSMEPSWAYGEAVGRILPVAVVLLGMAGFFIGANREETPDLAWRLAMALLVLLAMVRQFLFTREYAAVAAERESALRSYNMIIDNAAEGILRTTADGRILMANQEFARIAGYDSVQALMTGVPVMTELYVDPGDRQALLDAVAESGSIRDQEIRIRRRDGAVRWVSLNLRSQPMPDGGTEMQEFVRDITDTNLLTHDLKRTQRTLRVLSQFNQAMVRAEDEGVLLQGICDSLTKEGGYLLAWIGLAQDDPERSVKPVAQSGFEAGYVGKVRATWAANDPRGVGPTGRAIREGGTQIAQDILHDPSMAPWRQDATARGYAASCALPLDLKQYGRGALMVYAAEPIAFGPDEVNLLEDLADDLAYGVVSLRDRQAKKVAEAQRAAAQTNYRALFENMTEGFAHCRMLFESGAAVDWEYLEVNKAFGALTGLQDVVGKRVSQIVPGIRRANPELFDAYARVAAGGPPEKFEAYVPELDRWFAVSAYAVGRDEFVAVFDNITERKRSVEALMRSERRLREAEAVAHLGAWEFAVASSELTFSDEAARIFGLQPGRASWDDFLASVHAQDRARVEATLNGTLAGGLPHEHEFRVVLPNGDVRHVKGMGPAPEMVGGKPVRVSGTLQDITLEKAAWEAREALTRQEQEVKRLKDLNKMRMEFLNTAAHDLKTPLTPLKLEMATLRMRGRLDPQQKESLDLMDRNLNRFQVLVEDMLDAARLQSGRLKLRREALLVAPLVKEAVASFQESARQANLAVEVDPIPEVRIDADPTKAMQVLMNLVSNAVKYTPAGGSVRIHAEADAKEVVVSVRDSGLGMTKEQLGKLFQAFVRLHEDKPGIAKGTGLGLYICKGIVEQHGGRIWAESAGPGKGSTFHVAWPLAGPGTPATAPSPAPAAA